VRNGPTNTYDPFGEAEPAWYKKLPACVKKAISAASLAFECYCKDGVVTTKTFVVKNQAAITKVVVKSGSCVLLVLEIMFAPSSCAAPEIPYDWAEFGGTTCWDYSSHSATCGDASGCCCCGKDGGKCKERLCPAP